MSYHVEMGQSRWEAFFFEFLMLDGETGDPLPSDKVEHQLRVYSDVRDYGDWREIGQVVASNSDGRIYPTTQRGMSAIKVPFSSFTPFFGCRDDYGLSRCGGPTVRAALIAIPPFADDAKLISTLALTFGGTTTMARVTFKATPYYPAPSIPNVDVTQVKTQLAKRPGDFDAVEAALPGATEPATLAWDSGGQVRIGGPLANVIAAALGYDDFAMALFLNAAASNPV